ncbi:MAG TPA: hypothetical protein VIV06_11810 [Candidatus Limnocylindrales bacterium]
METARLVSLPSAGATPLVRVVDARIVIERLTLDHPGLAAFVASRPPEDRPALIERALMIGLTALQDVGVSVNVDVVRAEFEKIVRQTELANERAAAALEQTLRANFADGDGRLPRTLEKFLGDQGQLRRFTTELFDESKRDSAIGRLRTLLGTYFDGDASRLAQLLDPTRLGGPLYQFRSEIQAGFSQLNERLVEIEARANARAAERARSTAKGADFEDLLEAMLGEIARGSGDLLDRTATEAGAVIKSKKGDFVLTIDPRSARGTDLRIVVEAKDKPLAARQIREELRDARTNRCAAIALVVFTPQHAPVGVAPFDVRDGDVYCVVDPADPTLANLEAAVRLARLLALASLRERDVEVDAAAIGEALEAIRQQLEVLRAMKIQLTSIRTTSNDIYTGLEKLREGILTRVAEAEAELRVANST